MPLTAKQFIDKRNKFNDEFMDHRMKQMDYLEQLFKQTASDLEKQSPQEKERIQTFRTMAQRMHDVAHSHESIWNTQGALQKNLDELRKLPEFLEANDAANLRLLQTTMEKYPDLRKDLPEEDKYKNVPEHLRNINAFCDLGYKNIEKRRLEQLRERFQAKLQKDAGDYYRKVPGRQARFVANLLLAAADDLEKEKGDSNRIQNLRHIGTVLNDVAQSGTFYRDNGYVESRLDSLLEMPELLEKNDGENLKLLSETLKKHQDLTRFLPEGDLRNLYANKKTLSDNIEEVIRYHNMRVTPGLQTLLDAEKDAELKERARLEKLREENERRRREELEEKREADEINQTIAAKKQAEEEDKAELRQEEEKKLQEQQRIDKNIAEQKAYRDENGSFAMPPKYDNRDAAGMFVLSAKENGKQYKALQSFTANVTQTITKWTEFPKDEYEQRRKQVMKDLPENPTEEQMKKGIDDAIASVSLEEKKKLIESYYPDDHEQRLAAEREKLGQEAAPGQAESNLYRFILTEQFRDDLRKKTYTTDRIRQEQENAALELARQQLENGPKEDRDLLELQKQNKINDVIARQIKAQIIEGYRDQKRTFVDRHFSSQYTRQEYFKTHPQLRDLEVNEQIDALYETRMGELVDTSLYTRNDWDGFNQNFSRQPYHVPDALKTEERQNQPLNIALKKAKELPNNAAEAEKELLLERAKNKIPQEQIDSLAEQNLPLSQTDDQLLYQWARTQKQEELQKQILQERDNLYPEVASAGGIDNLKDIQKNARIILDTCNQVEPKEGEYDIQFDYDKELTIDPNLKPEQRKMLREEFKREQEELQLENKRKLHPKMQQDEDQRLKEDIQVKAAYRQNMTEQQRREDNIKEAQKQREELRRKRAFRKDWKTRLNKAQEDKNNEVNQKKDEKVKDNIAAVGDAIGALRQKLGNTVMDGVLAKSYLALDDAFTEGDLEKGKEYREKLGIEPEPKKEPKKEDKKQEFKNINEVDEIKSDELSDESVDNGMEYSAVEDIFYVDPNPKKMDIPDEPLAKVKPKQYIFQLEDVDKEKPEEKEEEKDVIIEELSGSGADADSKNYTNVIQADNLVDDMADLNTFVDTNTKVLWTATKSDPNMSKADRDWNLSNIIALHVLRNEIIKEVKQPSITNDALEQKAAQIRGDASYSRLFGKDSPDYLRRQTPDKMLTDYDKYAEEVAQYKIPADQQNRIGARLGAVTADMRATGSGKIIKYIPRGPLGNSTKYKNALAAINTVQANPNMSPDDLYRNTQIVLKYLDGKEQVRNRDFGNKRWFDCMTFLKQAMPPQKFKEYCDRVNRARNAANNPDHEDYVAPETFGSAVHSEACEEALDQIKRGNGRQEDYATLLALRTMPADQLVNKKQLTLAKRQIMQSATFQQLNLEENKERLHQYVVDEGKSDYKELWKTIQDEKKAGDAQKKADGPQAGNQ